MANEKKVVGTEETTVKATNETQETKATQETAKTDNFIVQRESFKASDGREMFGYFVAGKVRNRDVKVDFVAKDQGGYEILDMIFDIAPTATLIMSEEEMTDDNGKKSQYTVYEVQNVDDDGIVYKYKVKPARESDKAVLNILLQQRAMSAKKA